MRRRQSHLCHDGPIALVRVEEVEEGLVLDKYQPRGVFPQSIIHIFQSHFLISKRRITTGCIKGGNVAFAGPRRVGSHVPFFNRSFSPRLEGMMRCNRCFLPPADPQRFLQTLLWVPSTCLSASKPATSGKDRRSSAAPSRAIEAPVQWRMPSAGTCNDTNRALRSNRNPGKG